VAPGAAGFDDVGLETVEGDIADDHDVAARRGPRSVR
jgi:hypothetical protein